MVSLKGIHTEACKRCASEQAFRNANQELQNREESITTSYLLLLTQQCFCRRFFSFRQFNRFLAQICASSSHQLRRWDETGRGAVLFSIGSICKCRDACVLFVQVFRDEKVLISMKVEESSDRDKSPSELLSEWLEDRARAILSMGRNNLSPHERRRLLEALRQRRELCRGNG